MVRALPARARRDEMAALCRAGGADAVWSWLVAPEHRALLRLWVEAYARSLVDPGGPWGGFAERTVADWLDVLASAGDDAERTTAAARRFLG